METRKTRGKRVKYSDEYAPESDCSESIDPDDFDSIRKSRIRDSNKEFAKRMTILQVWSQHWTDYTTREGEAYPKKEALNIIKRAKKIHCPIQSCKKAFTTVGGLRYHYARCNIERCFKCKVCSPPTEMKTRGDLLRHMVRSHYDQLPELNTEQKEIAHAYLSSSGRVDKSKNRRFHADREAQMNCKQLLQSYRELVERSQTPESLAQRPFKDWQLTLRDWEFLTFEIDRRRYYPPEAHSVRFKVSSSNSWCTVRAGESNDPVFSGDGQPDSVVFFTGGINTAAAWLPKPTYPQKADAFPDLLAVAVNCHSMERSLLYKDAKEVSGCIQFWSTRLITTSNRTAKLLTKPSLSFMIGHNHGIISDMVWCPLGVSWQPPNKSAELDSSTPTSYPRVGLLALACGDGQIRIISVPHTEMLVSKNNISRGNEDNPIEGTQIYRVKPIATLMPPGTGPSTDYQNAACTAICWNVDDGQRLIAAGYSNGFVALFDLSNYSPILYASAEHRHIYQPFKSWSAHGMPVHGIAILSNSIERTLIATGSRDKQTKIWSTMDPIACLTYDKAPVTRILWDYRYRGFVSSTEAAFTSYQNRVTYKYPTVDGTNSITLASHKATVWGLGNSIITSSVATSDEAGEVFISPYGRPFHRRDRYTYLNAHSLFTLLPRALDENVNILDSGHVIKSDIETTSKAGDVTAGLNLVDLDNPNTSNLFLSNSGNNLTLLDELLLDESNEENRVADDFSFVERPLANKPTKFLLPIEQRAVETYSEFKRNYGLEFVTYDSNLPKKDNNKLPESCVRGNDASMIYCDRVCDYPFSSIKQVSWSPNVSSYAYLLSIMQVGLCRIDRVQVVEQIYKGYVESLQDNAIL